MLYAVGVRPEKIGRTIQELQRNMRKKFYFHLYRGNELVIVFKGGIFRVTIDKETLEKGGCLWQIAGDSGRAAGFFSVQGWRGRNKENKKVKFLIPDFSSARRETVSSALDTYIQSEERNSEFRSGYIHPERGEKHKRLC